MSVRYLLIVIGLLLAAMVLLCVRIILQKDGHFSSQDVGQSKAMQERGIDCTRSQDRLAQRGNPKKIDVTKL